MGKRLHRRAVCEEVQAATMGAVSDRAVRLQPARDQCADVLQVGGDGGEASGPGRGLIVEPPVKQPRLDVVHAMARKFLRCHAMAVRPQQSSVLKADDGLFVDNSPTTTGTTSGTPAHTHTGTHTGTHDGRHDIKRCPHACHERSMVRTTGGDGSS